MVKIWILASIIFILGCTTTDVTPQKTQLQIREFQTRTYDTNDTDMVMKATLNVLQDDGFIVKNVDAGLGFLTASKEGVAPYILWWKKNIVIECTVNISPSGTQTSVRVNSQRKEVVVYGEIGTTIKVEQIEDEKYYQDFFSKLDKGIFIQKELP